MKCEKIAYKDKQDAVYALHTIKNNSRRDKVPVRVYQCEKCNLWHLTSRKEYAKVQNEVRLSHAEQWNMLAEKQEIKEFFWTEKPCEKQIQKSLEIIFHNIDIQCEILDQKFKHRLNTFRQRFNNRQGRICKIFKIRYE